jgi:hypothetical protein
MILQVFNGRKRDGIGGHGAKDKEGRPIVCVRGNVRAPRHGV